MLALTVIIPPPTLHAAAVVEVRVKAAAPIVRVLVLALRLLNMLALMVSPFISKIPAVSVMVALVAVTLSAN